MKRKNILLVFHLQVEQFTIKKSHDDKQKTERTPSELAITVFAPGFPYFRLSGSEKQTHIVCGQPAMARTLQLLAAAAAMLALAAAQATMPSASTYLHPAPTARPCARPPAACAGQAGDVARG